MNRAAVLLMMLMLLGSCGGGGAVIRYYVIDAVNLETVADLNVSIQVLDIKLPQYLERFQIARRQDANQLSFAANHQWGEALKKNLYRTMTRNLSQALGTADVGSAISRTLSEPDYLLQVSLEAFEQNASGYAVIEARYQILDSEGQVLATHTFREIAGSRSRDSFDSMVADLQTLFANLSLNISKKIAELDGQHAT